MTVVTHSTFRPTVARIDLDAIRHNARELKPASAELMAVVKADGYGHGDVEVARAATEAGATWLGVALVEEGVRLRAAGIDQPILLLSECPPGAAAGALSARLTPTVYSARGLAELIEAAASSSETPRIHVKVDTGMHRVGAPAGEAVRLARAAGAGGLEVEGVWTHFARSEELRVSTTAEQLAAFHAAVRSLEDAGIHPRLLHTANSGATLGHPDSHLDLVRVGIALYGILPGEEVAGRATLRPVMSLRSRVSFVKRVAAGEGISYGHRYRATRSATIATIPIGYADGYRRGLSPGAQVLIRGRRFPVVGTITMDQLMVDVGDEAIEVGDHVVLLGPDGDDEIRAEELAGWAGTIGYEVVTGIGPRVPREYVDR
ncbi:MAG: alanine racemase [Actinomycetota bacterium]|nr:alanine racemase [Actinomycetota bacterium]